jgi:hypothetical protein
MHARIRLGRRALVIALATAFAMLGASCDPSTMLGPPRHLDATMEDVDRAWREYEGVWCQIGRIVGGFVVLNPTLFSELGCTLGNFVSRIGEFFPTRATADAVADANDAFARYVEAAARALRHIETSTETIQREADRGTLSRAEFESRMERIQRDAATLLEHQRKADATREALAQIENTASGAAGGAKGGGGEDPGDVSRLRAEAAQLDQLLMKSRAQLAALPSLGP